MTSHQLHYKLERFAASTTAGLQAPTIKDPLCLSKNDSESSIPQYSPWTLRRIASNGSKSTFRPKRPTKARLSKVFGKPQFAGFHRHPTGNTGSCSPATPNNEEHELVGYDAKLYSSQQLSDSISTLALPIRSGQADISAPRNDTTTQRLSWRLLSSPSPKFGQTLSFTPTLKLENSGSVARDHLASERTFLAYMRTSLTIALSGVVLIQLFTVASASSSNKTLSPYARDIHAYIRPLGAFTVIIGLFVLFAGAIRYFTIQTALQKGSFPAARMLVGAIALALTVLVILTFAILLSENLNSRGVLGY